MRNDGEDSSGTTSSSGVQVQMAEGVGSSSWLGGRPPVVYDDAVDDDEEKMHDAVDDRVDDDGTVSQSLSTFGPPQTIERNMSGNEGSNLGWATASQGTSEWATAKEN